MRVLVTGVGGQLGFDVAWEVGRRGNDILGTDLSPDATGGFAELKASIEEDRDRETHYKEFSYAALDITDRNAVIELVLSWEPDVIVHCAAWTAVDAAEDPENVSTVMNVNVDGTRNLAEAARTVDAKMVYISTDYVFDGTGETPWDPDCKDYAPINVYGQSKLGGELAVSELLKNYFIVRIEWVFGENGNNFIKTMLRVGKNHNTIRVVNDQVGTPTYTSDLARLIADMIETEQYGYYHATNEGGFISWYDFACEIFIQARKKQELDGVKLSEMLYKDVEVVPVSTEAYGLSTAARPFNSRLDKSKLDEAAFRRLPTWQDALTRYLNLLDIDEL